MSRENPAPVERSEVRGSVQRGLRFLVSLQGEDGSWRGDYGGPLFLLPMYVAAAYICRRPLAAPQRERMAAYLLGAQGADGSLGLHVEARTGTIFPTVLGYVALRLLGRSPDEPALARMRRWIRGHGTPLAAASWGKWILALLNLYDYDGLAPVLPELFLLPYAAPVHPGRFWCHARQVYLPMAYLYGTRARIPEDDLIRQVRREIYDQEYGAIRFREHRETLGPEDSLAPLLLPARLAGRLSSLYEALHPAALRRRALETVLDHLEFEDRVTSYIRIGPVNAVLNTVVHHFRDPGGEALRRSWETLPGYLWDGHDGLKMNGYNSCALWDTAFATQAILATPDAGACQPELQAAYGYLRDNQILDDVPDRERYFRHPSRGGWPFSDRAHGWPITDCTAEGLKCALALEGRVAEPIPPELLRDSVVLILSWQNRDGGWATYERCRGGRWLEALNPSQSFRDIMVDTSYVECTSACLQALARARGRVAPDLDGAIHRALRRGVRFLRRNQRPDGSWEGSWAVCFTYGTWFGVSGLRAAGAGAADPAVRRACDFLLRHQNPDGGWGEDYTSCLERRYVPHRESQAVHTSWALLTLTQAGLAGTPEARRATGFLCRRQREDGDWPRESLVGVFNKTTLINYENYRRYFCVWALAGALEG